MNVVDVSNIIIKIQSVSFKLLCANSQPIKSPDTQVYCRATITLFLKFAKGNLSN